MQLGVLYLAIHDPARAASSLATTSINPWCPLSTDSISRLGELCSSPDLVTLLDKLLHDPGIRFEAQCQVLGADLVVRCSLAPSDGRGASWRARAKDRSKLLAKLFGVLRQGWDVNGDSDAVADYVLATKVLIFRRG